MKLSINPLNFLSLTSLLVIKDIAVRASPLPSLHHELRETEYHPLLPEYLDYWYPREFSSSTQVGDEMESSNLQTRGSELFPFDFGYGYGHRHHWFPRENEESMSTNDDDAAEASDSKQLPPFGYYRHHRFHHRPGVYYRRGIANKAVASDANDAGFYFPLHRHHFHRPHSRYPRELDE